jgi:hypothetical protein
MPVAVGVELKPASEPAVHSPQPEAFPTTDWNASTMTPPPSATDGKTNTGDLQSDALPANNLPAVATQTPAMPVVNKAALKPASESVVRSPQPEAFPTPDSEVTTPPLEPLEAGGTPAAKLFLPMEKNGKMNKVAGLTGETEKVLPDDADFAVSENNLPTADLFARSSLRHESAAAVIGLSAKGAEQLAVSVQDCIPLSSVVDLHARAFERTHDMIAVQTMRLVDSKMDSLHVVIKPGAGMQLSLEMRQRGDGIDVQAVLQHGDFAPLNQHWPELQQRLESRGVHLAPLVGGDSFTANSGGNGFQSPPHEFSNPDPLEASAFAAFALAGPVIQPPAPALAAAVIHPGWESWA